MVVNSKRLNDNNRTDSYNRLEKTQLINSIQNKNILSKFDCKSGFWQKKMHLDSIEWTTFACPQGHIMNGQ